MQPLRGNLRILFASMIGTAVEYYDFFIYGTAAALFFGPLFFPAESPAAQTLFAFMSFGIAFFARPVGALAFGHFGDRIGRKSTLVVSLMLMGLSTVAIAFVPSYAMIGWVAPVLLCILRFGQGLGLGGEWAGAALLAVENAPPGWEARFGAAPQLGIPLGFIMANGAFLLLGLTLTDAQFSEWGWRVPFLASAVLIALGLWVRLRLQETPAFRAAQERGAPEPVPLVTLLRDHLGTVIAGSAGVVACYAIFYLATAYALAEASGPLGYSREMFLAIQLFASLFLAVGTCVAATLADRISPGKTIALGSLIAIPVGFAFGPALASGSLLLAGGIICVTLFFMSFANAPLGGWLPSLFPVGVRYSGVAFAFNLGGIIGGALFPVAAQSLSVFGLGSQAGLLLALAGLVSFAGVTLAPKARAGADRDDGAQACTG